LSELKAKGIKTVSCSAIGLDLNLFLHRPPDVSDATVEAYVRPLVERAAFALSSNEAWGLLAFAALLGLLLIPFAGPPPQRSDLVSQHPATRRPSARPNETRRRQASRACPAPSGT